MQDMLRPREAFDRSRLRPLRERQARAVDAVRDAVRQGHTRIILQAPCGFGKTLVAAHMMGSSIEKGKRPLFTCPAINLVNQTLAAFEAEGIYDIGVIQACHERTDFYAKAQIASVQTLVRRKLPEVDFVMIDEAHQQFDKLNELLDGEAWRNKIVIGLTATPWAKGMGLHWTSLVIAATTAELVSEGLLSKFRVLAPAEEPDLSGVKITAGDYNEAQLSEVMGAPKLVADVVKTWLEKGEQRQSFLFAVDRAHAAALQQEFKQAGVNCGYIDGFSSDEERYETFKRYRDGDDQIIASVGCLITGIDEDVRCIIDAAPTKSEIRHVQKIGRGLRLAPGKDHCLILDHAGNSMRLGLVTDIHHEELNTKKKGEKDEKEDVEKENSGPKARKCGCCGCIMPPGAKICPACGAALAAQSTVLVEDGELVEYGSGKKGKPATHATKQEWYSGLLHMAEAQGNKEGWAAHTYKEKFGVWPKNLIRKAAYPSVEVKNYVVSRRIAWRAAHPRDSSSAAIKMEAGSHDSEPIPPGCMGIWPKGESPWEKEGRSESFGRQRRSRGVSLDAPIRKKVRIDLENIKSKAKEFRLSVGCYKWRVDHDIPLDAPPMKNGSRKLK